MKKHPAVSSIICAPILIFVASLVGCGAGGTLPTPAPVVLSSIPAAGATGVPTNSSVAVTFDQAMDPTSLTSTTFTVSGVAGSVAYDATNKTAVFHPSSVLGAQATYTATVTTGARSAAGARLAQDHSFTFTTASAPDTTPPTIVAVSPLNGATNVPLNAAVTATFSEAMDPTGLVGQTSSGVSGELAYDSSTYTVTFTSTSNLSPNTKYTATVSGTAKDLSGNQMGADYSWSFTTGP